MLRAFLGLTALLGPVQALLLDFLLGVDEPPDALLLGARLGQAPVLGASLHAPTRSWLAACKQRSRVSCATPLASSEVRVHMFADYGFFGGQAVALV